MHAAAELTARSEGLAAEDSLVRKAGHRHVPELLQHRLGVRSREARVLCAVSDATRSTCSLSGEAIPAPFPRVAGAVAAGWVSISQAHAIVETLQSSSGRVPVVDLDVAERDLVARACGSAIDDPTPQTPEALSVLARRWLEHLDPDGAEPRSDEQLAQRSLRIARRRDGMVRGEFVAMPEQGDAIATMFDAMVKPRRVQFQDACDVVPVHVAARILCDGLVHAIVQDADGEPIRLGRRRRLFSKPQRRAIIARDHHCRAPGCTAPPGWCETHHVRRWADGGPTDVDIGILLCQFHHTEVHRGTLAIEPVSDEASPQPPAARPRRTADGRRRWLVTSRHRRRPRTAAHVLRRTP